MFKPQENRGLSRRAVLELVGLGAVAVGVAGTALPAGATVEAAEKSIAAKVGGKAPAAGKVKLTMPEIAENGNTVPLTVTVDSPMTDKDYVKVIHVVADGNPVPDVISFHLTPANGKAEVSTRMRMAGTQKVYAVAEMSDGSVFMDKVEVKVTIGGCGG